MPTLAPSALVADKGKRILLRLKGRCYQLSQQELRRILDLADGPPGLGITIQGDLFCFEFSSEDQVIEVTSGQLSRRLAKCGISHFSANQLNAMI